MKTKLHPLTYTALTLLFIGFCIVAEAQLVNVIRINSGGGAQNFGGEAWVADQHFTGGTTYSTSAAINNTTQDQIYQTERYGNVSYAIPVPSAGIYAVDLHLAEIYFTTTGSRLFNINIENGQFVRNNLDLIQTIGSINQAYVLRADNLNITDGTINITFTTVVDNAKISGISVGRYADTNPVVSNPIPDHTAIVGDLFSYSVPSNTFLDPAQGTLTYSASLSDGTPLPSWLSFNATSGTFSGTPMAGQIGSINIRVTAANQTGSVNDIFQLTVDNGFYRAININGAGTTVDGNNWEASAGASNFNYSQTGGGTFANQSVTLNPSTDANRATMIRSSVYGSVVNVNVTSVPNGIYDVSLYVWEDNASETYSISIEGITAVASYNSGSAGTWSKLGPFRRVITDGAINISTAGGHANVSGVDIRRATTGQIPVDQVAVWPTTVTLAVGQAVRLEKSMTPSNATNPNVVWTSSDANIASVDANGLARGVGAGVATITATSVDGGHTANSIVTVQSVGSNVLANPEFDLGMNQWSVADFTGTPANTLHVVQGAGLSGANALRVNVNNTNNSSWMLQLTTNLSFRLEVGKTYRISFLGKAESNRGIDVALWGNGSNLNQSYHNLNLTTTVQKLSVNVTINNSSVNNEPSFALKFYMAKGSLSDIWLDNVRVEDITGITAVTNLALSPATLSLPISQTSQLTKTFTPSNATNQEATWTSSNPVIATVNSSGLVSAMAPGQAVITAYSTNGGYIATSTITVTGIPVTGVTVSPSVLNLVPSGTGQLTKTVAPSNATDQNVTWSSDNLAVATVNTSGLVTAVAPGTASITATTVSGGFTSSAAVTVSIPVTGISITPATLTLNPSQTGQLTKTIIPVNATNQNVTWSSDNAGVATVDNNGLVTAIAGGTATISATTVSGGFIGKATVTVGNPVTGVSISPPTVELEPGQNTQLTKTIAPSNAANQNVNWSSSNTNVATVDANGLVVALAEGSAIITVTTVDGSFTAQSEVTVAEPASITTVLKHFAFQYKYDGRKRMTHKKVPGAGWVYMVYDNRDRLVMTQDGEQRKSNKWTFTKYDQLNRPILTGIFTDSEPRDQESMQTAINAFYTTAEVENNTDEWFEVTGGSVHGYTNNSFPKVNTEVDFLTVTYYDDYIFKSLIGTASNFNYDPNQLTASGGEPGQRAEAFDRVQGQVTGSKVKNLDTNEFLWSVNYYDDRYRVIQTVAQNNRGGRDKITSVYDFSGKVLRTKTDHSTTGTNPTTVATSRKLSYDHAGRLLEIEHTTGTASPIIIAKNEYNELGQLVTKGLHSENGWGSSQQIDYRYNIRGWLTRINDSNLSATDGGPKDYFGMELGYNASIGIATGLQHNGNISAIKWSTNQGLGFNDSGLEIFEPTARAYAFDYDPLNRLKKSEHFENTIGWNAAESFHENIGQYDLNGNIRHLTRTGKGGNDMDILNYDGYRGNQLLKVVDTGNDSEGFKDGNVTGDDYIYDDNGNMITDKNKSIAAIEYNHLNLPEKVTKNDGQYVKYIYNAAGIKLSQEVFNPSHELKKKTDYVGEFFYENDSLKFINHDEGRVVMTGDYAPEYQYVLKDHLGNSRITFTSRPDSEFFMATFEDDSQAEEQNTFGNYSRTTNDLLDDTDNGTIYDKILVLNGGYNGQVGMTKSFAVMPGDQVTAEVSAKYIGSTGSGNPGALADFAGALTQAFGLVSGVPNEGTTAFEALNAFGSMIASGDREDDDTDPKGFLNILVFDTQYNLVDIAYQQIDAAFIQTGTTKGEHDYLEVTVEIRQPGFVYVFLSNESETELQIGFDEYYVWFSQSRVIQQDDYYPFGLTFNSYQRENSVKQKFKFQGQEHIDDLGLGWDSFKWRNHQPDIGRFFNVDPLADKYVYNSPYAFSENHIVVHRELEGLEKVYIFDQANNPNNKRVYTGNVYVVHDNGTVNGPYQGSSYPNDATKHNTLNTGTHEYNNASGHKSGTKKGLNIVNENNVREAPGTSPSGTDVTMTVVNVHSGQDPATNNNLENRGSEGCPTILPSDAEAFFSNFDWSGTNETTGTSTGTVTVHRGETEQSKIDKAQIDLQISINQMEIEPETY